jgi:hypothetical protein
METGIFTRRNLPHALTCSSHTSKSNECLVGCPRMYIFHQSIFPHNLTPIVGTHCCETIGHIFTLEQERPNGIVGRHCYATLVQEWKIGDSICLRHHCNNDLHVVAWKMPLECRCIPKSTPFQHCFSNSILFNNVTIISFCAKNCPFLERLLAHL